MTPAEASQALWDRYGDAASWGVNSVGNPAIEIAGRVVTIFRGERGWGWIVRPLDDEPLAWSLRDNLPTAHDAKLEAWGALSLILRVALEGLALPRDIASRYAALVIDGGAKPEDESLAALREAMTPDEIELAKQVMAAEYLRRLPTPERPEA